MPTLWAHGLYFNVSSTAVTPALSSAEGGYPLWMPSGFALGSVFGPLGPWVSGVWATFRWWQALYRRVRGLQPESRVVLLHVLSVLESPAYTQAQLAVRQTAVTLGFNRPEAWQGLSRAMKSSPGRAENTFRHLNAWTLTNTALRETGSTLSGPLLHLTVELAYHGMTLQAQQPDGRAPGLLPDRRTRARRGIND